VSDNDIIILNSILGQDRGQKGESLSDTEYFQVFAFEQILKDYELSYEEILKGSIDGGDDGGIDGLFVFINDDLLDEDSELTSVKKNPVFGVFLIQAKTSKSFAETAVEHVITSVKSLFDLTKDMNVLRNLYNSDLINKVERFRHAYVELAVLHPVLKFSFTYVTKGDTANIHPKVREHAKALEQLIEQSFSGATAKAAFMGARELLDASRVEKSYTLQLQFLESYLSKGDDNYIVLSSLRDYYEFVTDENGNLRRHIFESNVRDYQGNVEVNKDIQKTLETHDSLDFWWLNNGISVLASKASISGKTITLDNVLIVNGLQTTTIIHSYFKDKRIEDEGDEDRSILIRIIVTEDSEARDRIIKATNFQTVVPVASLKATERIQRDIEDYFLHEGWFYDRRKNYYKNLGKPINRIISIPSLAQAVMAIILKEPDNARARPSSLIKSETDYARVFNESIGANIYLFCARVMKRIEAVIRNEFQSHGSQDGNNLKFHTAMALMAKLTGTRDYAQQNIEALSFDIITDQLIVDCFNETISLATQYATHRGWTIERLAKNREFVDYLLKEIEIAVES
jgi:hypothetical protein